VLAEKLHVFKALRCLYNVLRLALPFAVFVVFPFHSSHSSLQTEVQYVKWGALVPAWPPAKIMYNEFGPDAQMVGDLRFSSFHQLSSTLV